MVGGSTEFKFCTHCKVFTGEDCCSGRFGSENRSPSGLRAEFSRIQEPEKRSIDRQIILIILVVINQSNASSGNPRR